LDAKVVHRRPAEQALAEAGSFYLTGKRADAGDRKLETVVAGVVSKPTMVMGDNV
jgi:hypothetical protein